MDKNKTDYGCEACRREDLSVLSQVGEPERKEFLGGDNVETHTRFVCRSCGATWVRIVERGAGGRSRTWSPDSH